MATSLSLPVKPPSKSFLEAAESSNLLDWELDSLMTEKDETIARSLFNYRNLKSELKNQCEQLSTQQEHLDISRSHETATILVMGSWGALDSLDDQREESRDYARQICDLTKQILSLKISVLCLKIARLGGAMKQLQELETTNGSKCTTPPELCFQKFDEWVQSNEQIYNLQSNILDLEAKKVRLYKGKRITKERRLSASSVTTKHSFASVLEEHPGKGADTDFLNQFAEEVKITDATSKHEATLNNLLRVCAKNQSFEACKLKAYIRECWEVDHIEDDFPTGVHHDRYQEFVGGMCQYIVDRQFFGALSYDFVFAKLEHHLMPAIYTRIKQHMHKPDDDAKFARLSNNLSCLSQTQFGIKEDCRDSSLAPYFAAISALKTCTLCLTPSGKIFQIVKAAKLVFEILNQIAVREHRSPPGADEFMDVWVYVVLKANIPNFASTIAYLKLYSNPSLSFSEAGYYLSSIEFACQYILRLSEHDFPINGVDITDKIVVCEQRHYKRLASEEEPMFEIVSVNKWLSGYELYAVKEWQLDPLRFYNTVLLPSSNPQAKVQVSVIKVNKAKVSSSQMEYLKGVFLQPSELYGLASINTTLGRAIVLNPSAMERTLTLIPIPSGQYDQVREDIKWYCTLGRLSCIQPTRQDQHRDSILESQLFSEVKGKDDNEVETLLPLFESDTTTDSVAETSTLEYLQFLSIEFVTETVEQKEQLVQSVYNEDCQSPSQLIVTLLHLLLTLGYLNPLLETFTPFFSNVLLLAVRHFQTDVNETSEGAQSLPTNGHLTPMTFRALKDLVTTGMDNLRRLGFHYNGSTDLSTEKDQSKMSKFISECQDSLAIDVHMKGALDSQTREEIKRLVADM